MKYNQKYVGFMAPFAKQVVDPCAIGYLLIFIARNHKMGDKPGNQSLPRNFYKKCYIDLCFM